MTQPPKILITGTYCSLNRGDAAMQIVCASGLAARIPDARIAMHVPFPAIDGPFYERRDLPVVPSTRRRLLLGSWRWLRMASSDARRGEAASTMPYPPSSERRAIMDADLVIDLSGDMLTEDAGLHVAYSHYLPLLQTLAADVPLALCAQSVGPFRHTAPLARRIFEGASLVTLRESRSTEHLRDIKAEPGRLEVTADLSFALAPASEAEVDKALSHEGVAGPGPWVGVSLSGLVEQHRKRAGRSQGSLASVLAPALQRVAEEMGARLLLVPHVFGPKPVQDDRRALRDLRATLGGGAHLLTAENEPEVLKGMISRCRLFVGARMHTVMAALSTGVPVLALAYSHKAGGIMREFGMDEWVVDAAKADSELLAERMLALVQVRDRLADELGRRSKEAARAARRNLDLLADLLVEGDR